MIVSKHFGKGDKSDNFLLKRSQQILIKSEHPGQNLNRIGVVAEVAKVIRIKIESPQKIESDGQREQQLVAHKEENSKRQYSS
jgi:hypothetical protein